MNHKRRHRTYDCTWRGRGWMLRGEKHEGNCDRGDRHAGLEFN